MLKLVEKPLRKFREDMPEMQDRMEYLRCILGWPIDSWSRKLGKKADTWLAVVKKNKLTYILPIINQLELVFGVNKNWLLTGNGYPYPKNIVPEHYKFEQVPTSVKSADEMVKVGKRVAEIRGDQNLTQSVFAATVGSTLDAIAKIEKGKRLPTIVEHNAIVTRYGVSDPWMLRGEGGKYPNNRKGA